MFLCMYFFFFFFLVCVDVVVLLSVYVLMCLCAVFRWFFIVCAPFVPLFAPHLCFAGVYVLSVFMFCRCLCTRARIIHLSAYNSSTSNDASICRALQTGRKVRYAQGGVFRATMRAVRIQSWCAYNSRGSARNAVILICRILFRLPVRTTRLTFLCPALQPQYAETIHSEQLRASVSRLQAH